MPFAPHYICSGMFNKLLLENLRPETGPLVPKLGKDFYDYTSCMFTELLGRCM